MSADGPRTLVFGSRGIGRAIVLDLARRGTCSVFVFHQDEDAANALVEEAERLGARPLAVRGDVSTEAAALVARATEELGGLDLVTVTAVPIMVGRTAKGTHEQFARAMDVVVWGFIDATRAAADAFGPEGGSVIGVSSLGSWRTASYYGLLGPAKAALESAVRYLAVELARRGVRVNAVSPCLIEGDQHFQGDAAPVKHFLDPVAKATPMGRLIRPDEVARMILALGSEEFRFVTGQTLVVDGGYSLTA